ncbi:universal stress protein [Mycobacterium nebraskense]|uniref:Universal stress protein n=1 Tax=Mycobacterium nebraskense TaxID=244292 RepID=A0A1X1ZVD3_9MYCO|nr:universal stress protein [Mycobacterium nebraskense]KKC05417.1 universal stress protein [Mycobacterium nebraskense]MBI2695500.1 universal stress protein [Mycobacterium nebraskense]MCV7116607.1 universal stress protein [Mycobacterium nebraskense]ORW27992.1 universal stress protein [Mycobacterium nebraskense]
MSNSHPAPAVVVGVDGSRAAERAALWAIDEAASRDIPMRLVYVIDPRDASTAHACEARLAAARTALSDAHRSVDATGAPVKIETDILCGRPLAKLMEESRSAAMMCVGSIGLNHARHGGTSVATSLARSARCPVAVIHQPARRSAVPKISNVLAEVDNGMVLRHAFEEARLRGATLRALWVCQGEDADDAGDGMRSAQAQLSRRLARWTRLYPDVRAESAIVRGSVEHYLRASPEAGQLLVTDCHTAEQVCSAGHSVLAIRCSNL